MKKFLPFLASLLLASVSWGQTGNGVLLLTDASYTYTPTTVDSSMTFNLSLKNDVGIAQVVYFGGLDAPFELSSDAPIEVPSQDTVDFSITFTPSAIGSFSDTLEVIGNVFGSASLVLSGDGIQVQLEWTPDTLAFDVTPIGQTSIQTVALQSVGDGTATIENISFSNEIFVLVDSASDSSIDEGDTGIITVAFNPDGAGTFEETLTFETNDPNNAIVSIALLATSISEVSGETCDAVWSLADSPFTLVGDVEIPVGCTLEIEPGTTIQLNGYDLNVLGDLICVGTETEPIIMSNGYLNFGEGNIQSIDFLELQNDEYFNSEYDLIYYNNFESQDLHYDFDCFLPSQAIYYEGQSTGGTDGCSDFNVATTSSWSFQENPGDNCLYWRALNNDGILYLAEPLIASSSGVYEVSFMFETNRFEQQCTLGIEFFENGQWVIGWESRADIESSNTVNHFATASTFVEEGEEIQFRIIASPGSTNADYNDLYIYMDEFRVERKRKAVAEQKWDMSENASDFEEWANFYGQQEVWFDNDTLYFHPLDGSIDITTNSFSNAPVEIEEDGWYIIEVDHRTTLADQYNNFNFYYSRDANSWYRVFEDYPAYGTNYPPIIDWRTDRTVTYTPLQAGDRIDFRLVGYIYSGSSSQDQIHVDLTGIRLYKLDSPEIEVYYTDWLKSDRELSLSNSQIGSVMCTNIEINNSQLKKLTSAGSNVMVTNSSLTRLESTNAANVELTEVVVANGFERGIELAPYSSLACAEVDVLNHYKEGIYLRKNTSFESTGLRVSGNAGIAIQSNENSNLSIDYALIDNNQQGLRLDGSNSSLELNNSRIRSNTGPGITSESKTELNHCNLAYNGGTGLVLTGNNFHTLNNSILWGNNSSNYTQIDIGGGVISTSYSTVQGRSSYGTSGSGQYYWGEGVIEADPLFADDDLHLEIFSPCVDGGQPWHQDAYMPFGLGGVRADMGMYGGPDNAYWGGEALPDGASALTGVSDSPQDQGGVVGLVFDASFYDNSDLVNNVTSYAFWRHYDPTGQSISTLDEGNWELIGEMPAQSFNGYAYQAQTLGNTNAFGTFNSCYTVVAQTDDPDTYWYSNVLCGESVDNLAPMEPELAGMVLETGGVTVFWELPAEEDYAYTEVTSDAGFAAEVTGDTLAVDLSAELGGTYTYTAVHYDVNGNASDPSSVTLAVAAGSDIITLNAGWNLISTDREETLNVEDVFAGLTPGNLQYVTGFDGGVQFYDPNGLAFLNTLNALTPGMGYWVKVADDDVLEVSGARLDEGFMLALAEGWNLIGYAPEAPQAPGTFFAELEAAGDLLYVTGFDQGTQLYNPNGLPFLNTLAEMRNGYGYWVKSAAATEAGVFSPLTEDALLAEQPTPLYDVVNGVSELKSYAGQFVDVLNSWGVTVARLPILEGGHLMTTALFGDDPATAAVEGLVAGETLHFAFRGAMANETLVFGGDMAHKTLSLTFDEVEAAMGVFPNPASDVATFRFQVDLDAQVEVTLVDLAGRQVAVLLDANKGAGAHAETLTLPTLEAGAYTVQLRVAGEVTGTQRLVVTH